MGNIEFCQKCGSEFLGETPGKFVDFDADPFIHGTFGFPLCSSCIGTGIVISEFADLSDQVSELRSKNFAEQLEISKSAKIFREKFCSTECRAEKSFLSAWFVSQAESREKKVAENNQQIITISQKALAILEKKNIFPINDCLALLVKQGNP